MGSIELTPSSSFGYDFEDGQTREQLELIDDLHRLGLSRYVDLPQLVVVGDQSTGKSSVLQAVTDVPFSIDDEMCTRFEMEIVLRRSGPDHPTTVDIRIIPDPDETAERRRSLSEWRPNGFDPKTNLDKVTVKSIFQQAEKMIFPGSEKRTNTNHGRNTNRLSSSTLQITRCGPVEPNFTIVDIPGLVRGNEFHAEHRTARHLVDKYLKNSRGIIVVVIDVVDIERQEIIQLVRDVPNLESRVIGVINKCDTKQTKSNDWVFDLIRNDPSQSKVYLKEGWYGLRNRRAAELGISDEERDELERKFFDGDEWKSLDRGKLGRKALRQALIQMRNRHVKGSIPGLLSDIQNKLDTCITDIQALGEPRITNQAQFTLINRIATRYSTMAENALNGHYEDLTDDKLFARKLIRDGLSVFQQDMVRSGIEIPFRSAVSDAVLVETSGTTSDWMKKFKGTETYAWISAAIDSFRAKEEVGEVNPEVKNHLWKEQTKSWEKISALALENTKQTIESVSDTIFEKACPDFHLRNRLRTWLHEEFGRAFLDAKDELDRLLKNEREAHLLTLDPRKEQKKQWYTDARVNAITEKFIINDPDTALPQAAKPPSRVNPLPADVIIRSMITGEAELLGIFNTHDSLAAYYDIALYRFIDNFALQVVERHLLGPRGPLRIFNSDYVSRKLYGPENDTELNTLASEDPVTAQKRAELGAEILSLKESKRRVQNFKAL